VAIARDVDPDTNVPFDWITGSITQELKREMKRFIAIIATPTSTPTSLATITTIHVSRDQIRRFCQSYPRHCKLQRLPSFILVSSTAVADVTSPSRALEPAGMRAIVSRVLIASVIWTVFTFLSAAAKLRRLFGSNA
jgi:hypothetical protein